MDEFITRIGIRFPILQAGMGGGIAGADLAAAVTAAGGLGTLGMGSPSGMHRQLVLARERATGPIAVNLLLPFVRRGHASVAAAADVVVTFWGKPERRSDKPWIHQVGSVSEAQQARAAGADAVIVQGVESGGHVRGTTPALELLERCRDALPGRYPLLLAGGIADAKDVAAAIAAGAAAAVCGTRFLMSEESGAAPGYKTRLSEGTGTVLTELFGVGWPGAHRVLPNLATQRWLRTDPRGPRPVRLVNRVMSPLAARGPESAQRWMVRRQRVGFPFFTPVPPVGSATGMVVETSPLYAGETVARIGDIRSAGAIVADLAARLAG